MAKRILLAGVLGGIAMFVWASVAHMALPLGQTGIKEIPDEEPVLNAMQIGLGRTSGLYMFPGMGLPPDASRQQQHAAMQQYGQKLASSPSGLLIYHPPGGKAMTPGQLGTEFLEAVEALLVVWLLAQTRLAGFGSRVGFVAVAGILAAITTNIPYWNWYGFPKLHGSVHEHRDRRLSLGGSSGCTRAKEHGRRRSPQPRDLAPNRETLVLRGFLRL